MSRRTSRESSNLRNPLVRSLKAKSSSSNTSSLRKKSTDIQEVILSPEELTDELEATLGLTPITLAKWIVSKGQSYGSVYLLPFAHKQDEAGGGPAGYRYRIVATTQLSAEQHFYTLRYEIDQN